MTSPELTGGAGFTYEDAVAAYYLVALVGSTTAAGLASRVVERVAQQQADFGEPLDDIIVDAIGQADGTAMRMSLQVKRELTISSASSNSDFREVIQRSWQTLQKPDFREHVDRVGAIIGSVAEETFRSFTTVCEWARASDTIATFMMRFADGGNASASHRAVAEAVRQVAQDSATGPLSDDQLYRLFQHLTLIRFDFLQTGSTHEAEAVASLQRTLVASQVGRAGDLWNQLRQLARDGAGRSAAHTKASVLRALVSWRFNSATARAADMQNLRESTRHWLAQQADDIGGMHLDRQPLRDKLAAEMEAHRLTLIKGLPGTGKTVLLRDLVQRLATDGTTLFLTANRLAGRSWAEHARAIGLSITSIEPLLVEVAATGHATLFIDGLDRIAPEQRAVVTDLLGQLLTNPALVDWRVVATARDAGIEPLRNWVPGALLVSGGVGYVDVENLSSEEAVSLAETLPALRPLLTGGDERVRTLARRPFFAAVLARGFSRAAYPTDFAPQSEVELVDTWWSRGGYDSQAPQALARQRALVELAQHSAPDLGRNVRLRDLSATTQTVLPALEEDGLVQQVRIGHTAQFSHDIFFEWSFFHLLLDQSADWIDTLTAVGEPPALARVVELLSQATYSDREQWPRQLHVLEQVQVRPQWLRAWLVAPVFGARFAEQVDMFSTTLAANEHRLFGKLLVWMQAEKTTPNPLVLSGRLGSDDLEPAARIRLADLLGWPSDFLAWRRLLLWALEQLDSIPDTCLPDLVTLFETWQVAAADYPNPVSQRIVSQCASWLQAIDDRRHSRRFWHTDSGNDAEPRPRAPTNLETELRALVLRAARAYPDIVDTYLAKVIAIERRDDDFQEVMTYAPLLSSTHPALLAEVGRRWFMRELPDESVERWHDEAAERRRLREELRAIPPERRSRSDQMFLESPHFSHNGFSHHDWDRLSIGADHRGFFPASPEREPFHSLLANDPQTALALIRDVTNHAATAWRQLHRHWRDASTPLPLILTFPWGQQEFWGDDRHYAWFRGHGGPQVVECALMALEHWALAQAEAGRSLDEVIRQILEGHTSIAVVGVAVHLALRTPQASATTLALLGNLRLCRLDLQRKIQEPQLVTAGLIGFNGEIAAAAHHRAITESAQLPSRRRELRDLIPYFVLGSDIAMRDACRMALDDFPNRLEFAYEEEGSDANHVAGLRHTAELWSELGHIENYSTSPVPGRNDVVQISVSSPRHQAPEVQAALQQHVQISREMELWLWVEKCFSSSKWATGFTPDEAVARAKELTAVRANGQAQSLMPGSGFTDGAIAGTAAAITCYSDVATHSEWAATTIDHYRTTADEISEETFAGSVIPWHPKIFVAHALAAQIRAGNGQPINREALYRLVAHPLETVSLAALSGIASCWDRDQRFAWSGLNLGLRLAQLLPWQETPGMTPEARREAEENRRNAALIETWNEYQATGPLSPWVRPLPSWIHTPPSTISRRRRRADDEAEWQRSEDVWHNQYAAKILKLVPVAAAMATPAAATKYVDALEALVAWTLDTLNPTWRTEGRRGRERDDANLFEWQHQLGRSLAHVALHASETEMHDRLLHPILEQPDEIAMQLLEPFAEVLVCAGVLDAPQIQQDTLQLLTRVLERTLEHGDLQRSPYNDGRLGGFDLPELVKSLLFVSVEGAPGAERFANGQWGDLAQVMPLVDRLIRQAGWNPYVARQFVTLCERAGSTYPADTFADQVLAQMVDGWLPTGWKGTTIPASIAALVQAHADRQQPLPTALARKLLRVLDALIDLGDRRSAALQQSESFRGVRLAGPT
ncbi:NACHT domain [Burkholderia cepacia]|uniref:NACHT domain n=2 Tax=Burkholderia cepacia TaxID=292 RepID=A0AAE8NET4_BURCE|nr:NACHT domain [Burkholderia cepacia]